MAEVTLRRLSAGDEAAVVAILRDPRVSETFMLPDFANDEEAAKLFQRLKTLSAGEDIYVRGGYVEGRLAGFINQVSAENGVVEVGYVVSPALWGRGVATAMLSAAMAELFERGFHTVRAGYFEGNVASRRVMEKCGMAPVDVTEEIEYRGVTYRCFYMERNI